MYEVDIDAYIAAKTALPGPLPTTMTDNGRFPSTHLVDVYADESYEWTDSVETHGPLIPTTATHSAGISSASYIASSSSQITEYDDQPGSPSETDRLRRDLSFQSEGYLTSSQRKVLENVRPMTTEVEIVPQHLFQPCSPGLAAYRKLKKRLFVGKKKRSSSFARLWRTKPSMWSLHSTKLHSRTRKRR
jgi:hypothetical protein